MPTITKQAVAVAANTQTANLLAGELYEVPQVDSAVRVYASASAVGINMTFMVGGVAIINDSPIPQSNRFPVVPDDLVLEIGAMSGERLFLTLRETAGGAGKTANIMVVVEPV